MPETLDEYTARRFPGWRSRAAAQPRTTPPGAAAEPVAPVPADLTVPDDLAPFWPAQETQQERDHIAAFVKSQTYLLDNNGYTIGTRPVDPAAVERERHAYRRRVAQKAKHAAERGVAQKQLQLAASTCAWCRQVGVLAGQWSLHAERWVVEGGMTYRLPVLGEVTSCRTCRRVLEARVVELLRDQELEHGRRGELIDAQLEHVLNQKQPGA